MAIETETSEVSIDPGEDDAPYTAASVSRLFLSLASTNAGTMAMELVSAVPEEVTLPDEALTLLPVADKLLKAAQHARAAAIHHAHTVGANWEQIAEALGQQRQSVYRAHNPGLLAWKKRATDARGLPRMPAVPDDTEAATTMDGWLARHGGKCFAHEENRGVSNALRRMTSQEELDALLAHAREPLPLAELAAVRERQTVLYERLAVADPEGAEIYRRYATRTRAQAEEIRRTLAQPPAADTTEAVS